MRTTVVSSFDKRTFMKCAHALARTYQGDYIARLALAMRVLHREWRKPVMVAEVPVKVQTSSRYSASRAYANGLHHLELELERLNTQISKLEADQNITPFEKLGLQSLYKRRAIVDSKIILGKDYQASYVYCSMPRYKRINDKAKEIANKFVEAIFPDFDGIYQLRPEDTY